MNDIEDMLRSIGRSNETTASDRLKARISATLGNATSRYKKRRLFRRIIICTAAVSIIIAIISIPRGMSATQLLKSAGDALKTVQSFEIVVDVRTTPTDNFSYIDPTQQFVEHRVNVIINDSITTWRVSKAGRVAAGDNSSVATWLPGYKVGWIYRGNPQSIIYSFTPLLDPAGLMESELRSAMSDNGSKYTVKSDDSSIYLTIHTFPEGDFSNPYMFNKSIRESENIRRYSFDKTSHILRSASVAVITAKGEVEVFRLNRLDINVDNSGLTAIPPEIKLYNRRDESPMGSFADLQPREVATIILDSFADWDSDIIDRVIDPGISESLFKERYSGASVISIGQPFQSGINPDLHFIPYTLRLSDGNIFSHNLVLQHQPDGNWILDGGL